MYVGSVSIESRCEGYNTLKFILFVIRMHSLVNKKKYMNIM